MNGLSVLPQADIHRIDYREANIHDALKYYCLNG
jgi:hypothetical protein